MTTRKGLIKGLLAGFVLTMAITLAMACGGVSNADCREKYKLLTEGVWYDEDVKWFEANCTAENGIIVAR